MTKRERLNDTLEIIGFFASIILITPFGWVLTAKIIEPFQMATADGFIVSIVLSVVVGLTLFNIATK